MTDSFESILDESISALQAGIPIEEVLAEVPDYAGQLRPLLYAAMLVADPNPQLLPDERKEALRAQYLAQAATLPPVTPTIAEKVEAVFRIIRRRLTRKAVLSDLITITVTVFLTLLMSALILSFAAADTLPGDWLYGLKRVSEEVRLALTFNQADRLALEENFNQERIAEIEALTQQNRAAVVQFRGTLDAREESLWIVEGFTILLPDDVAIQGEPQEGDRVEVMGLLRTSNVLIAETIKKIDQR